MRFYLAGLAVFTAGSLLAAASMSGAWLIASRVVQGGGAALLSATSAAIVTAVFPPSERGRALGINVMAVYIGLSVGPPLGGFLTDNLGWRWIFLVNLPIGIAALAWGLLLLPRRERENTAAPRPDVLGAALLGVFLVCLLVPLTFAPEWGWAAASTIGLLTVSALSLVAFVAVERRVADPVLDLDLVLHNRLFAAANTAALLNYMALYAISLLTAIYLEVVQGRSAGLTGWLMLGQPVMQAVAEPLRRTPERPHRLARADDERHAADRGRHGAARDDAGLGRHPARGREPRRGRRRPRRLQRAEHVGHHGQRAPRPAESGQRLPRHGARRGHGAERRRAGRHRREPARPPGRPPAVHATATAPARWPARP